LFAKAWKSYQSKLALVKERSWRIEANVRLIETGRRGFADDCSAASGRTSIQGGLRRRRRDVR
jgi:hypothetical protein